LKELILIIKELTELVRKENRYKGKVVVREIKYYRSRDFTLLLFDEFFAIGKN